MTVAKLVEILENTNPEAPVLLECCGFILEANSVEVRSGWVCIQGY